MPSYPLYVPLLPGDAQRVLGEPNETTLLAYDIHLEEGFEPDRFVDIFDAGPVLTIAIDKSASASSSELRVVREVAIEGKRMTLPPDAFGSCVVVVGTGTETDLEVRPGVDLEKCVDAGR